MDNMNMNGMDNMNGMNNMDNGGKVPGAVPSLVCGIASLVIAVIGGITFGIIGAAISIVLGIIAVVLGINAKKNSNNQAGGPGFICGLLGLILGVIFAIGCSVCGCLDETDAGYTCYGLCGGSCMMAGDIVDGEYDDYEEELQDALDELENWDY